LETQRVLHAMYLSLDRKAHVACNFSYLFENVRLFKVTASHVHCKSDNISETAQRESWLLRTTNRN